MKNASIAILGLLCLTAGGAHPNEFGRGVLEEAHSISVGAGNLRRTVAAQGLAENNLSMMLSEAVAQRQQVRRHLLANGGRLTKEQTGSARGSFAWSFFLFGGGISGSFSQEQHEVIVKGGEFFVMAILSPEAAALIEDIRSRLDSRAPVGTCVRTLYANLTPIQQRSVASAAAGQARTGLETFRSLLDRLEPQLEVTPASDPRKQQFTELATWGRGSLLRVVNVKASAYRWRQVKWYSTGTSPSGTWALNFETPGVTDWSKGCDSDDSPEHIEALLKYNFLIQTEDIPVY